MKAKYKNPIDEGTSKLTTLEKEPLPPFAPLRLPLRRRLQSLAVLWFTTLLTTNVGLFVLLWSCKELWPFLICYIAYIIYDRNAKFGPDCASQWLRRTKLYRSFCQYFPITLHRSVELDPKRNYILGYHPHGIIAIGAFGAFCTEGAGFSKLFPGIKIALATLTTAFKTPFYREWIKYLGLCPVSKRFCQRLLQSGPGYSVVIVVGGAAESLISRPGEMNLVLKRRKGFVKLALETNSDLVPCIGFGENDAYSQIENDPDSKLWQLQNFMKKMLNFTLPLFHGRGTFNYDIGLLPRRSPINIVVGKPIHVEDYLGKGDDAIDLMHQEYTERIESIWNEYKDIYSPNRIQELEFH